MNPKLTLKVCPLPVIDLSYPFLYSFYYELGPTTCGDTIWMKGRLTTCDAVGKTQDLALKEFGHANLERHFGKDVSERLGNAFINASLPDKIGLSYYEITPKKKSV